MVRAAGVDVDDLSALLKDLRFLLEPAFEAKLGSYMQPAAGKQDPSQAFFFTSNTANPVCGPSHNEAQPWC